jgi:membrane protein implicated in regulation of membrane protease activity
VAFSLFLAGLMYWLLYKFLIKRLKESDASAFSYQCLTGKTAEVTLTISGDAMGTISMRDSTGAAISFRAKLDPDLKKWMPNSIQRGESVVITGADAERKLCYVAVSLGNIIKHKMGEA